MSAFGQVIPFRARQKPVPTPAKPVHRSLSAALADAGLEEPPPLTELTVEPEAGLPAEEQFSADGVQPARVVPPAPVKLPARAEVIATALPVAVEAPLPRVIAFATRHPPSVASYPWMKSAKRRRFKTRLSDAFSWLVTIAIVAGMIGVAATYLTPLGGGMEPVAQQ